MFCRLELIARSLGLSENEELQISFNSPHQVTVTLRRLRADELKSGYKPEDNLCIITAEKDPPKKLREYFEKAPTSAPPPQLEQFSDQIDRELSDYGKRTLRLLRWRSGSRGHHNPIRYSGKLEWSWDREHWNSLPSSLHGVIEFGIPEPKQIESFGEPVAMMMQQKTEEPLGHELFREAWELRTENPRSALILDIAAAEIGFKQCVGTLVPDAKLLVDSVPSPPLANMLREYLPKLPARKTIKGHVLPPPKRWLDTLKEGATIRNQIVHGNTAALTRENLGNILKTIRELLYLLDIYCGHGWAWDRLGGESQRELLAMTQ